MIRYGGWKIPVEVRERKLQAGWSKFISCANLVPEDEILVADNGGGIACILVFRNGEGVNLIWDSIVDASDIESDLVSEDDLPGHGMYHRFHTTYFPGYVPMFFGKKSGVCVYDPFSRHFLQLPPNIVNHLRDKGCKKVDIHNGDRVFDNVDYGLGYLRGDGWVFLAEECKLDVGFKLFFFITGNEELEMIVMGYEDVEVAYEWSREYYRIV